jgi:nucleotide-binding universal stress UspA family protein
MKTVLLYANDDSGMESRLQAALDLARPFEGHISCLQATPFDAFIMGDPFGGVYALPVVIEKVRQAEDEHRARIETRLRGEGASWDWARYDGSPAQLAADRSRLCDLIVLSLPAGGNYDGPLSMVGDVVLHARAPVLAVPQSSRGLDHLGTAVVAWNGTLEACYALRLAVPLLRMAAEVRIVTVREDETEFPATGASEFLARHGIESVLHEWPRDGRRMSEALLDAAHALGAAYLVMGAYGHSRMQESLLGGTTREMIRSGAIPLLLAH